jgi:hypothetical protein
MPFLKSSPVTRHERAPQEIERLVGRTVRFTPSDYPFDALFLEVVQRHLDASPDAMPALDCLHNAVAPSGLGPLYAALYGAIRSEPFASLYAAFIERVIAPCVDAPARYQRVPGIRVHLPDTQTVMYHTDEWYGHGGHVLNFWLPLTPSFGTNALWIAPLEASLAEVRRLEAQAATMAEINARLAALAAPITSDMGEVHVFCARVVHGTERNTTGRTRVSLDFRLMREGEDPGSKPLDEYYARPGTHPLMRTSPRPPGRAAHAAVAYLFARHGFTRFVSAHNQRLVVTDFARTHGLTLVAEETEIATMAHHPALLTLATRQGVCAHEAIVAYSVLCLPQAEEARRRIYAAARAYDTPILFANENLAFPDPHGEPDLERTRALALS